MLDPAARWRELLEKYGEFNVHDSWLKMPGLVALLAEGKADRFESEDLGPAWSLIAWKED